MKALYVDLDGTVLNDGRNESKEVNPKKIYTLAPEYIGTDLGCLDNFYKRSYMTTTIYDKLQAIKAKGIRLVAVTTRDKYRGFVTLNPQIRDLFDTIYVGNCLEKYDKGCTDPDYTFRMEVSQPLHVKIGNVRLLLKEVASTVGVPFVTNYIKFGCYAYLDIGADLFSDKEVFVKFVSALNESGISANLATDGSFLEIYLIEPKMFTKDIAVAYDIKANNVSYAVCTGDSHHDFEMYKVANVGIFPEKAISPTVSTAEHIEPFGV